MSMFTENIEENGDLHPNETLRSGKTVNIQSFNTKGPHPSLMVVIRQV